MANPIHDAMLGLSEDDVHIDSLGRAVITHPGVVDKLAQAGVGKLNPEVPVAGNIICTGSMPGQSREALAALKGAGG